MFKTIKYCMLPRFFAFVLPFVAAAAFVLLPSVSAADFYIYTDENGARHITDAPTSTKYVLFMSETGEMYIKKNGALVSIESIIRNVAKRHEMDPSLIKAVIKVESDFDKAAISRVGARGLMQLMPETAKRYGVKNIHDPYENINGGVRYLKALMAKFDNSLDLSLAAYNAGETAVLKYKDIPPYKETKDFVKKVLKYHSLYKANTY
ncbi:MAG: lytic transglycosylase domain-containing protein [Deltaproteobacteria bacterium]|nr:lytic transglycosylase domain-containing protein [Deltaproteobacteria bacterium]